MYICTISQPTRQDISHSFPTHKNKITMKKILRFLCVSAILLLVVACSKDDKDSGNGNGAITIVVINDQGNTLTISYAAREEGLSATVVMQFLFENDLCTSATSTVTFPSANMAQMVYQEILEDEDVDPSTITIRDNVITQDLTSECEGLTKQHILALYGDLLASANE